MVAQATPPAYRTDFPDSFQAKVLGWACPGRLRDFPWRLTRDPYLLLISELMLRRTQARQVEPVFLEFLKRWPDLESFYKAEVEDLKLTLQPLGLQWRIRNVLEVRKVLQRLGHIPTDYSGLIALPGVGDYVASAVLCFSHQLARPLIDTNTVRLIGRYFGITVQPGTRRLKSFRQLSETLVPRDPGVASVYHYALLDLAATICRPKKAECSKCPLATDCLGKKSRGNQ